LLSPDTDVWRTSLQASRLLHLASSRSVQPIICSHPHPSIGVVLASRDLTWRRPTRTTRLRSRPSGSTPSIRTQNITYVPVTHAAQARRAEAEQGRREQHRAERDAGGQEPGGSRAAHAPVPAVLLEPVRSLRRLRPNECAADLRVGSISWTWRCRKYWRAARPPSPRPFRMPLLAPESYSTSKQERRYHRR
jgi:hypothetical protein